RSRVGHGKNSRSTVLQILNKLIIETITWSTHPGSHRVTTLNHEVVDYAVKLDAIIEGFRNNCGVNFQIAFNQSNKIGNRHGCFFHFQLTNDDSFGSIE